MVKTDFVWAAVTVTFSVCKPVRLLVVCIKCSLNLITNPNPVYIHTNTCDIFLVHVDLTSLCKVLCLCGTGDIFNYINFNMETTKDITSVSNNYKIIPK
jgi:hypothetical protein